MRRSERAILTFFDRLQEFRPVAVRPRAAVLGVATLLLATDAQARHTAADAPLQLAPALSEVSTPPSTPEGALPNGVAHGSGSLTASASWIARQQAEDGTPACLIRKENAGFVFAVTTSASAPGKVVFSVRRSDWSLPAASVEAVRFDFDDGTSLSVSGVQAADGLTVAFDASNLKPWMHEFTKAGRMTVTPGDRAFGAVPISLTSTTPAITEMSDCVKTTGLQDVPPPFQSASAAAIDVSASPPPSSPPAKVGPSMSCMPPSHDALVLLSCSDPDLARSDITMVQTYYAMRGSADPGALKVMKTGFLDMVIAARRSCGLPPVQPAEDQSKAVLPPVAARCVASAYDTHRAAWLAKLSGSALQEASRAPEANIALQLRLQVLGFVPASGKADGVFGTGTRDAIRRWQTSVGREATGLLGDGDAAVLLPMGTPASNRSDSTSRVARFDVGPLAEKTFDGKPTTVSFRNLSVTIDREAVTDPDVCGTASKHGLGIDGRDDSNATTSCDALVGSVSLDGKPVHAVNLLAVDDKSNWPRLEATVAIRRIDPKTAAPQVMFTAYSGGAHCCTAALLVTQGDDGSWHDIILDETDGGGGYEFADPDHSGALVLVSGDQSFDYAFASYAGSYSPVRLQKLSDARVTDATRAPEYHSYVAASASDMQDLFRDHSQQERNGFYAAWIADEALIGNFKAAWSSVADKFEDDASAAPIGPASCKLDTSRLKPEGSCPDGEDIKDPYPLALAMFLEDGGYITNDQAKSIGFDVRGFETTRAAARTAATDSYLGQKYHGWFEATRDGTCVAATEPASPAALISYDKQNGLTDEVDVVRSDDDGTPTVVKVEEPQGNEMVNVLEFFHSREICEDQQKSEHDELQKLQ